MLFLSGQHILQAFGKNSHKKYGKERREKEAFFQFMKGFIKPQRTQQWTLKFKINFFWQLLSL